MDQTEVQASAVLASLTEDLIKLRDEIAMLHRNVGNPKLRQLYHQALAICEKLPKTGPRV